MLFFEIKYYCKSKRTQKRSNKLNYFEIHNAPPETNIASIKPAASAAEESTHSIKRIVPVMVSPTKISLTELVMATPGTRSIISPIIILSGFKKASGLHNNEMPIPDKKDAIIINVILFLQRGVNLYYITHIKIPNSAEITESYMFPPKNRANAPDANA